MIDAELVRVALEGMPSPESVRRIEEHLLALPQIDLKTSHVVHGGLCWRTIIIPAGTMLTGALANIDNVCILCGDIYVTTDAGPRRLTGFHIIPANAGFKRVGVAVADTYWTTVWPTDLTDIDAIEDEMTCESAQLQTRRPAIEFAQPDRLEV